mmetsp:Transcript_4483/g.15747  ORF Transcript_4483/g.15747 Transcript_4483/m.15747 type:complete len:161 (-) Transcript_4483:329-811(-)|eukprot:CAMPEP_0114626748 /NCGR_PEP_ID=MMETSP0168-20121206/11944_1 /TAXON_ID=95228 ORGANISM="Vannella sp., Strain DIVA3 517/6/12" /NCGR_SAMPLE_ID=MMETSP0168 /ASSEMBLY_ACC=CAM_ASM_000044 /LENGTH=160 /DNA_ID=CAMNT_0001838067 /DNA_START=161 /DNA_END=643 /DNA_ORIENTATION=-
MEQQQQDQPVVAPQMVPQAAVPAQGRPMQVCRYFLQNRCAFGDRCRNVHPAVAPFGANNGFAAPPGAYPYYQAPRSNVCRFFLRGVCAYGDSCRFEHPADQAPDAKAAEAEGKEGDQAAADAAEEKKGDTLEKAEKESPASDAEKKEDTKAEAATTEVDK